MDGSKPRKSDAAATRKRRSSILKSQRNVRAPLSELEFNVATPDQAKSRRVSFSRRTGVAEFEISEATTAWKNVYEEHNKSLESSANESGVKAAPRRVSHLGGRASHFEDEEADVTDDDPAPPRPRPRPAQLEPTTTMNTLQFCQLDATGLYEATDNLDVHFSAVAPLALPDDLDLLQQDLQLEPKRDNINEISIDIDFNSTHFSLKVDDDDMSITDTIRSPAVAATEKSQVDFLVAATKKSQDWTADKENIVINPYVAPPPAEFPCEDDILVFDGKKCKFQSKLDLSEARPTGDMSDRVILPVQDENIPPNHKTVFLDDMTETRAIPAQILQVNPQRTVVFADGDISITQAVPTNIIAPNIIQDKENQNTMYFNDLADMSVTQALPADIFQNEPQHSRTIVYGDDGHISMTQAVPNGALFTGHRDEIGPPNKLEETRRKTIVYDNENVSSGASNTDRRKTIVYGNDDGNVSMTGVVPANIIDEVKTGQPTTDMRKTVIYGNDDGNLSITRVVPVNVQIDEVKTEQPRDRRTIVYDNDEFSVSMTRVLSRNIIDEVKDTNRRQTVVFGNDNCDLSITGVAPANILEDQQPNIGRSKTIVYGNDEGNISMTGVVPVNILEAKVTHQPNIDHRKTINENILQEKVDQQPNVDRRRTVVFENDDGDLSMTGLAPVNILEANVANIERRKTIVYDNNDGNISMTGVVTANILEAKVDQQPNIDRRRTVVFENNDGDLSMTGVAPVNILEAKTQQANIDRRKTILYDNNDGHVSMTGVVTANILEAKVDQQPNINRRRTVVFENNEGDLSMTGVAPVNILEANVAQQPNIDRRKTILYDNNDGHVSMTGVVTANILEAKVDQQPNIDRRRTVVFDNNEGDLSMTGVAPVNILEAKAQQPNIDRRKTILYDNNDGNVSMTGVVTANIIDQATLSAQTNIDRRKDLSITGLAPVNILDGIKDQELNEDRRKTVVYGNDDNNISITGEVPAKIFHEAKATSDRKTIVNGADDGNMSTSKVLAFNQDVNAKLLNVEHGKTIVYDNDHELCMTATVNIVDETKQNIGHKSVVYENNDRGQQKQQHGDRRQTVIFGDDDANMSGTRIVPENILEVKANQPFNDDCRKTVVNENEDGNVSKTGVKQPNQSAIGILLADMLDKEHDDVITHPNTYTDRKTSVNENVSVSAALPNKVGVAKLTVVYEDNFVSMTDLPGQIMTEDTNVAVPETLKNIVCENTEIRDNLHDNFEGKEDQIDLIEAVTAPILIESDEDEDVFMQAVSRPQSPNHRSTLNKSLAATDALANQTFDKSVSDLCSVTISKSLAGQNCSAFEKTSNLVCSTTFNKSSTGQALSTTFNKSLDGQDQAITNKSLAGQDTTINKTLTGQAPSTSMNKSSNKVFVYGATTKVEDINMTSYLEGFNREDYQSQKSPANDSLALSKSSGDRLLDGRSPIQSIESKPIPVKSSVLDTLLDMSHASEEVPNECQSKTSPPVSNTTIINVPTTESYILVKDDEDMKDCEIQTEVNEPIAVYKKEHGIVCRLQQKLSALKNVLHIKEKSPKKDSVINIIENQELPQLLRKSSLRQSTSSPEKNKSVTINLTARIPIDNMDDDQNDNHTQVDLSSISKIEEKHEPQGNTTKCQANDTRAILDALSDFTDTRRSGDFEPVPSPDKTRRTSAPDRKSMVISREDMLREISMAQELMKTEMQDTELEVTECSSDEQESPHRISGEVVKTLRFEDDESILDSKILQKPSFNQNSPRRLSTVIPDYELSDPVKELMNDLIKPLADIEQPLLSKASESSQANTLDSSQIDLIPSRPILLSPRSCLRQTQERKEIAHSETHVTGKTEPVILFDHLNPLNNILLPPLDLAEVHEYNPRRSEESISPSLDSKCCQTESESWKDVDVAMVLVKSKTDRAVVQERSMKDSGVDTSSMKGSLPPHGILVNTSADRSVANEKRMKDTEANTSIVMKANRDLLAASSSLTLVDDALSHTDNVQIDVPARSPVRVIFKLDEADSSVQLGSELTSEPKSDVSSESGRKSGHCPSKGSELDEYSSVQLVSERSSDISAEFKRKKRGHNPSKGPEVTPKPASKVQKVSNSAKARKPRSASQSEMDTSVTNSRESSVTVAPLYACARSETSASATDGSRASVWRPELLHELSSKNLISEQEPGVNVVAKIDVLPFMGTSECEWESRAADTWSFLLLRARLRLLVRLEHRATNTTRVLVRADTPVRLVLVQHTTLDREHLEPVAELCLVLAADTLQRLSAGRGGGGGRVARAGQVPALLRRCAAVVRVALRWGKVMSAARAALAFSLQDTGELSLKVANIPMRSVWEVTLRIQLSDGRAPHPHPHPHPRAADLRVSRVVAAWAPGPQELRGILDSIPEDWGHVPRTIWKIFKYLKNKKPEDDFLTA